MVITPASCQIVAGALIYPVLSQIMPFAGATIIAGQVVYLSAAGTWLLALSAGTLIQSGGGVIWGVALHGALAGQPLIVLSGGPITIGATLAVGTQYAISANAGKIAPYSDLTTGNYVSPIGLAISTSVLNCSLSATGIQHA